MSKPKQRQKATALDKWPMYIYNEHGAPYKVFSLAAFCKEYSLELQQMKDVVRGKSKQHRGWHLDSEKTASMLKRAQEIKDMMDESQAKYGVPFEIVHQPQSKTDA